MKNIRTQLFVLFITVLLLMGCGVQKNIDLKSDQGMKIANAFVPDQMMSFTGDLDGGMYIYGPLEKPRMHGDITLDSVSVYARQAGLHP